MSKNKPRNTTSKRELSEGKAIALAVLLITAGLIGAVYLLSLILDLFFPGLIN